MAGNRFILDAHLGKLARNMRMLGFDAVYDRDLNDEQIIQESLDNKRSILSKDRALLLDKRVISGYFVIATDLTEQLIEVIKYFDLINKIKPFTRCLDCNGEIIGVDKKEVEGKIPESILNFNKNFTRCDHCKKIFWEGSHQQKMADFISKLKEIMYKF